MFKETEVIAVHSRYQTLFEFAPEAFLVTDMVGIIQEANRAAAALLNVSHQSLIGLPFSEFLAADDLPTFHAQRLQLAEVEKIHDVKLRLQPRDGAALPVSLSAAVWRATPGSPLGLLWVLRVMMEQQQGEAEWVRSHAFVAALGRLSARLWTSLDPDRVMETLGGELKKLGVSCVVALLDPDARALTIRYASIESDALALAEKLTGLRLRGFRLMSNRWPIFNEVIEGKRAVFVPDGMSLAVAAMPGLPQLIIERALRLAGVTLATRGIYLPLVVEDRVLGVFGIWGENLRETDVPAVSILASLVAAAFEVARLHRLAEQAAVMEERGRLARELHDSLTQSLYSITLVAEAARRLVRAGNLEQVEVYLTRLGETAQQALKEMRLLVYHLRPSVLRREGLVGALRQRLDSVEKRAGVEARLEVDGSIDLPPLLEEELYRIAQEALNNAWKHSAANVVTVRFTAKGKSVELEVADNGKGFQLDKVSDRGGMGLASMRERAAKMGTTLVIRTKPGAGTSVKVTRRE